ncbi:MAG: ABC transporter substrate-binding protein [Candidatus Eisenbacteria sp.]|nr:ABC transporter substrate-binding protein [Candidatus Eisenbacteria bacterium]
MVGLRNMLLTLVISLGLVLSWCPGAWSNGVLILNSRDIGPFRQAVEGLTGALDAAGVNVVVMLSSEEPEAEARFAEVIVEEGIEVVVTVGTVATDRVLSMNMDLPTVFCMVLDPEGKGFVDDPKQPGGCTTGVEMDIPIQAQLEALRETVPGARRIGVLYSTDRNRRLIELAAGIADSMGLKLVPAEVASDEAVPKVLRDLTRDVDALWGIPDPIAFSSISTEHIILTTLRCGIPFMGLSASFVKAGALLALSCDYQDMGRQASENVLQILAGQSAGGIPVSSPRATALHLSLRTARLIGIEIPSPVVAKAKEVRK